MKKYFSMFDFLQNNLVVNRQDYIDPVSASILFNIWKDKNSKIGSKTFNKNSNISTSGLQKLEKEGLINLYFDKIQITKKGADVIKVLILGDERSSFDQHKPEVNYIFAKNNIKVRKGIKKHK